MRAPEEISIVINLKKIFDFMLQIKLSVYDDGAEATWVTFKPSPGMDWFQGMKVVDSFPWNTAKLKDASTYFN